MRERRASTAAPRAHWVQGGWPVVAPDLGAFAERLQGRGWTWVQPWDQTPAQWLAFFEDIRQRHWLTGQAPQPCAAAQPEEATHHIPPAPERPLDWYLTDYLVYSITHSCNHINCG